MIKFIFLTVQDKKIYDKKYMQNEKNHNKISLAIQVEKKEDEKTKLR